MKLPSIASGGRHYLRNTWKLYWLTRWKSRIIAYYDGRKEDFHGLSRSRENETTENWQFFRSDRRPVARSLDSVDFASPTFSNPRSNSFKRDLFLSCLKVFDGVTITGKIFLCKQSSWEEIYARRACYRIWASAMQNNGSKNIFENSECYRPSCNVRAIVFNMYLNSLYRKARGEE